MEIIFEFKKIKIQNFQSIGEAELKLADRGLVLITGNNKDNASFSVNGVGKSACLNAITYSLYGQTSYGIKADDVVNRHVGKNLAVKLYVDIDGQAYRIERYRKHKTHKNKVKLFKGNTELTGKSMRETDQKIQDLFGIDYETYMNSIMQGQGDSIVFSQATDKGKKEILENVTNIAIYQKAQEVAKEKVKETNLSLNIVQEKAQLAEIKLENLEESVEEAKNYYKAVQQGIDESKEKVKALDKELDVLYNYDDDTLVGNIKDLEKIEHPELDEQKEEVAKIEKEFTDAKTKIEMKYDNELSEYEQAYEDRTARLFDEEQEKSKTVEEKLKSLQDKTNPIIQQFINLENELNRLEQERSELDTAETCPTCGQAVDASHIKKHYDELTAKIQEIDTKLEKKPAFVEQVENATKTINQEAKELTQGYNESIASANELLKEFRGNNTRDKVSALETITEAHKTALEVLTADAKSVYQKELKVYKDAQEKLQEYKNQLSSHQTEIRVKESQLEDAKQGLKRLEDIPKPKDKSDEIDKLNEELKELNEQVLALSDDIHEYEDVVKIFSNSGIRSVVLDLVTPFLNEKANEYMATLSGSDIEIQFSTQTQNKDGSLADKFSVDIVNHSGGEDYKSNSEGEKRRIDMAISFAIQDLVLSKSELQTNIALYDECFEGLDEVGCENVIQLLKERVEKVGTIFVITHNEHLKALFENVLTIEKENGVSRIVDQT